MPHDELEMIEYRDQPAVLIFGDSEEAIARARAAAAAADCRVVAALGEAAARLDVTAVDAIYAELGDAGGGEGDAALLPLLDRFAAEAAAGRPGVIAAPLARLDLVAARAWRDDIHLLADPDPAERASALALASRPL